MNDLSALLTRVLFWYLNNILLDFCVYIMLILFNIGHRWTHFTGKRLTKISGDKVSIDVNVCVMLQSHPECQLECHPQCQPPCDPECHRSVTMSQDVETRSSKSARSLSVRIPSTNTPDESHQVAPLTDDTVPLAAHVLAPQNNSLRLPKIE